MSRPVVHTVKVYRFRDVLPRFEADGRRILHKAPDSPDWIPLVFHTADGRLPARADGRVRFHDPEGVTIGTPGAWGTPDEFTLETAPALGGYWCDLDDEVVDLGDLVANGAAWMVPPEVSP
jgi:hypothetical protein